MRSHTTARQTAQLRMERLEDRTAPAVFTVTNTNDSGTGSLRQAIINANSAFGADTIQFAIPAIGVQTIRPTSQLPDLLDDVTIDGFTQPGSRPNGLTVGDNSNHLIEINGASIPLSQPRRGLNVTLARNVTIRGLVINGFDTQIVPAANTLIIGNFLGIRPNGSQAGAGSSFGIRAFSAAGVQIGGTNSADRNVISGNSGDQLSLSNDSGTVTVQGNYIGTNSRGTAAVPIQLDGSGFGAGIAITGQGNIIGGTASGAGNVISGNNRDGLFLTGSRAHDNQVLANLIGTSADGVSPLANGGRGVTIQASAQDNTIGSVAVGAGNVIAFNTGEAVVVNGSNTFGNSILRNSIFANEAFGIRLLFLAGETSPPNHGQDAPVLNSVTDNGLQTVFTGQLNSTPNDAFRIELFLTRTPNSTGGFQQGEQFLGSVNVRSDGLGRASFSLIRTLGFQVAGERITATATDLDTGDTSQFSAIRVGDRSAEFFVTNTNNSGAGSLRQAILDANAHPNVGGLTDRILFQIPGTGVKVIQPLTELPRITDTLVIDGYTQPGSSVNTLATGSNAVLQVQLDGFRASGANGLIVDAPDSVIRGLSITNFDALGLIVSADGDNTSIVGNFVGLGPDGSTAKPNNHGVLLTSGAIGATLGGTAAKDRNVVSGNNLFGVTVEGPDAVVQGNLIGTDKTGSVAVGQFLDVLLSGATNTTVGGSAAGAGNVISGSGSDGVQIVNTTGARIEGNLIGFNATATAVLGNSRAGVDVESLSKSSVGNTITNNRITGSGGLGIELGRDGVTANDVGDGDTGPNNLQNFPDITKVVVQGATSVIVGSFASIPNTPYRFEFFSSNSADASGFGEGETLISSQTLVAGSTGGISLFAVVPINLAGKFVTLTATNLFTGDTSEFSRAIRVTEELYAVSAGPGGPSRFKAFNPDGTLKFDVQAYDPAFTGGIRVATGDVTGDGVDDIITAACAGGGPHVKVFDGVTGTEFFSFLAYAPGFIGGVWVAAADFNGDGKAEIVTGVGPGGGPHVKVIDGTKLTQLDANGTILDSALLTQFFAYDPNFTGGVNVAAADVTGAGHADVVTGAGAGGGPHVKVFNGATFTEFASFFAYAPNFTGGVFVAAGQFNTDGKADVVTGAGPGAAPHTKVIDGTKLGQTLANGQIADSALLSQLFAFDLAFAGGVRVAATDVNSDGKAELVVAQGNKGNNGTNLARVLNGLTLAEIRSFQAFDPTFNGGIFVG